MGEVKKLVTRYSRDFNGNLTIDPNGSWVLAEEARLHAKRLCDVAQSELAALREELNEKGWDEMMTRLEDQNDSLRQRLTVAEQRNAELSELLNLVRDDSGEHYSDNLQERILAALKPTHQIGVASK